MAAAATLAKDFAKDLIPISVITEQVFKSANEKENDVETQFAVLLNKWETLLGVRENFRVTAAPVAGQGVAAAPVADPPAEDPLLALTAAVEIIYAHRVIVQGKLDTIVYTSEQTLPAIADGTVVRSGRMRRDELDTQIKRLWQQCRALAEAPDRDHYWITLVLCCFCCFSNKTTRLSEYMPKYRYLVARTYDMGVVDANDDAPEPASHPFPNADRHTPNTTCCFCCPVC